MHENNNTFLKVITHNYPDLQIYKIHLHDPDEGQYNHVLSAETNTDPLIFRFPRSKIGVATIQNELRILGRLQNQTTLPVPNPALQNFPIALRHGDFGTGNVLYDPHSLDLTGVIDFGFSGLGNPAIDIAALSTLGDTFYPITQH
jgi:aminoglycoside phosphotransferase (APT) family kinase protein